MKTMKKRDIGLWAGLFVIVLAVLSVSSCTTVQTAYHGFIMRGSVVEVFDSEVYLCIGSADGATVGQELNVHRISQTSANPKTPVFVRHDVGKVKITAIVDEHFARAAVLSGKVEKNDIVELVHP